MLKEAQKLQKEMEDIQKKLETEEISVSNQAGTIKVAITGSNKFLSLDLKDEIKNLSTQELSAEILKTFQEAIEAARKKHEEAMKLITASLSLPGLDDIKPPTRRTSPTQDYGSQGPRLEV